MFVKYFARMKFIIKAKVDSPPHEEGHQDGILENIAPFPALVQLEVYGTEA